MSESVDVTLRLGRSERIAEFEDLAAAELAKTASLFAGVVSYTPGPWQIDSCGPACEGEFEIWVTDANGAETSVAQVFDRDSDGETRANASLIAAAPELLEALKSIENDGRIPAPIWEMRNAAIAKAKGVLP